MSGTESHAGQRSKDISKMHQEWKSLGRSNQNEQLWKQFKQHSDQAYESCKEYFKERKQIMADNLAKRRELCEYLEGEHLKFQENDSEINISGLNKLLNQADSDWKKHAPIEQNKIKKMQKRFYETVNKLRKLRKASISQHGKQKKDLIRQAQELVNLEDNNKAMTDAKRLQQEWKGIGPTSYKEDNRYWQDFRSACDAIFAKRNQQSGKLQQELSDIEARLNEILANLESILKNDDTQFRESRTVYQDLAQEFSNGLDPRLKSQRKRLLDRFNVTKRQIDGRYRALPDKKQLLAQQSVKSRVAVLEEIEYGLLNQDGSTDFENSRGTFDRENFDALAKCGVAEVDKLLESRAELLSSVENLDELKKHCATQAVEFRTLCIQAEIRADIETPAEDKPLRMKLQLEQLQGGLGQAKPDPQQNIKYAQNLELKSYAMGPLEQSVRTELNTRLNKVLQKLR